MDLRGNKDGITFIGNWMKPVLGLSGGGAIPAGIRNRFAPRKFTPHTGSPVTDIAGWVIGEDGKIRSP
jgi:hypothetical protein